MTEPDPAPGPPDELLPTLRLAAILWLVAYALHIVDKLSFLPSTGAFPDALPIWLYLSSAFAAPDILGQMSMAPLWFRVSLFTQVFIAVGVTAALAWTLSSCLIASAARSFARHLSWAVIAVAVASLLLGLFVDRAMSSDHYRVARFAHALHLLDPLAGVLLALVLRTVGPRVNDRRFTAMLTPLLWLAIGRMLMIIDLIAPDLRLGVYVAIAFCTIASGLMFALVMARLWYVASKPAVNPSAA